MVSEEEENASSTAAINEGTPLEINEGKTLEPPEKKKRKSSALADTVVEVREKKGLLQAAIPTVPRWFAWICLFFNVFVPGLGTSF